MKLTPTTTTPPSGLLLFFKILFPDIKVHKIFSDAKYFAQTLFSFLSTKCKSWNNTKVNTEPVNQQTFASREHHIDEKLCSAELNMVMNKLGLPCDLNGGDMLGAKEVLALFEEEPSLDEVREAFDVFDENRDGFIDATELQRVLCVLRLQEVSEVEDCSRMISAFDENGDGVIDFSEFVKFMEKCFY